MTGNSNENMDENMDENMNENYNEDYNEDYNETKKQRRYTGMEIAVIGMAGRFPGAPDIHRYWENLKNGIESAAFFTDEELKEEGIGQELLDDPHFVKSRGALLEGKENFDAAFFGYTPREAEIMDPQMRLFHECAWHALEHGGYSPGDGENGVIGLYGGSRSNFNWTARVLLSGRGSDVGGFAADQLTDKDFLCSRVAYKLNLRGPAVVVQTACSTSLAAIHMACRALLTGECDMALAGGVSLLADTTSGYLYQEGMVMSPDGRCRAFDADARGTFNGEGAGLVLLKRLQYAQDDGDTIHAVILGSAMNNDGQERIGFTAPGIEGQARVIDNVFHLTGVEPESIGYVETHGTGTPLGDPIEIEALKQGYDTDKTGYCPIGSVKTNIGHLDAAAGVAGFIKTVQALKHRAIPPSLNFHTPNPKIDFQNSPFYVNKELTPWRNDQYPSRAGISSFGIGGTNVHIILEEAEETGETGETGEPVNNTVPQSSSPHRLLVLSAKTENALETAARNLARHLRENPGINMQDVAYTLQVGRPAFPYRRIQVGTDACKAAEQLEQHSGAKQNKTNTEKRPVVFMFSGLGSQYVNMGRDLYREEPLFKEEMDRCFSVFGALTGKEIEPGVIPDIKKVLYPHEAADGPEDAGDSGRIYDFQIAQAAVFSFEYALAKLLIDRGIKPDAMIGYSFGEYTAAAVAGVFTLEDALRLIIRRGRLIAGTPPGAMLSVPLPVEELEPHMPEEISLAIDNGQSCVVAGTPEAVGRFEGQMKEKKYLCQRLRHSAALHSYLMKPILDEFERSVREVTINEPQIPYISNVSGDWITGEEVKNPHYWRRHLGEAVQFHRGLASLVNREKSFFLEIGPGSDLAAMAQRIAGDREEHRVMNLVRQPGRNISDTEYLENKIGFLWLYGMPLDWKRYNQNRSPRRIPLPGYPFEGERYWIERIPYSQVADRLNRQPGPAGVGEQKPLYYIPQWRRSQLNAAVNVHGNLPGQEAEPGKRRWLIFSSGTPFVEAVVEGLKKEGVEVAQVKPGEVFRRNDDREFILPPAQPARLEEIVKHLAQMQWVPDKVLHMWGVSRQGTASLTGDRRKSVDYEEYYSLVYLAKALADHFPVAEIGIDVLTDNLYEVTGDEELCPEKAALLGPLKVIPQEYGNLRTRSIDIVIPPPGTPGEENRVRRLISELTAGYNEMVVAFRGGYRWVEDYEPVKLDETHAGRAPLRQGGVYLITGGLGETGLQLARYLAEKWDARLVLTSRTGLPPEKQWPQILKDTAAPHTARIRAVEEIRESGGQVMVCRADVSDYRQMENAVIEAEKRFGPINGIIHRAGITCYEGYKLIQEVNEANSTPYFVPKIDGLQVLERLFQKRELDFRMVFSSISAILGGLKFSAFSAANAFIDVYVKKVNRRAASRWITLDWDTVAPEDVPGVFLRTIALQEGDRLVVSGEGGLQHRIDRWIRLKGLREEESGSTETAAQYKQRPPMVSPYVAPADELEKNIVEIWQNLFGIKPIGIEDNFVELGGDSLKAITLVDHMKKKGYLITLKDMMTAPTVKEQADAIRRAAGNETGDGADDGTPALPECIKALNECTARENIFILHPFHGMTNPYVELGTRLNGHYNLYGIEARGLSKDTPLPGSALEMVEDYIRQIKEVQPQGPYKIAGFCLGNQIAYYLAAVMEKNGDEIEKWIAIEEVAFLKEQMQRWNLYRKALRHPLLGLRILRLYLRGRLAQMRLAKAEEGRNAPAAPPPDEIEIRKERILRNNIKIQAELVDSFVKIDAPVLVTRSAESQSMLFGERDWRKLTRGAITIRDMEGGHNEVFQYPYVEHLAEIIKANL